jgi:sirohydrochlorin cobaltochelatase
MIPAEDESAMTDDQASDAEMQSLDAKINAMLPSQYQHCYDDVQPVSMGSAGLKYGPDGKVAWDEIWTSFCDLALAGGPPHRGTLLESVPAEEALAEPEKYQQVVEEIGRGIWLVTQLPVLPRFAPGWVAVRCQDETMAAWLVRAVVVENIFARQQQSMLLLPAGPHFQLAKEIKNVITTVAKTCHYWTCHMSADQQAAAAVVMNGPENAKLLQPASVDEMDEAPAEYQAVIQSIEEGLRQATPLKPLPSKSPGWVGIGCVNGPMAVWLMRVMIVENILARREADVLYLPARPQFTAEECRRIVEALAGAWRLWKSQSAR